MACYSPLKGWKSRHNGGLTFDRTEASSQLSVPCGGCLGCRLTRTREWAMRIVHESDLPGNQHNSCFVTLTYRSLNECTVEERENQLHIPDDWSLNKKHMQRFFKRLRKAFPGNKIRYFYAGEYGNKCKHGLKLDVVRCPTCRVGRPHYHICLFGVTFPDLEPYGTSDNGRTLYTSPTLERIWKYGNVDVGDLNYQSAAYTAGYILKKVTGAPADDHYQSVDINGEVIWIEPEYVDMSRRPGIGHDWLKKYSSDIYPGHQTPVPGKGMVSTIPRYYDKLVGASDEELMEVIKQERLKWAKENAHDNTPDRLMSKFKCAKANQTLFSTRKL